MDNFFTSPGDSHPRDPGHYFTRLLFLLYYVASFVAAIVYLQCVLFFMLLMSYGHSSHNSTCAFFPASVYLAKHAAAAATELLSRPRRNTLLGRLSPLLLEFRCTKAAAAASLNLNAPRSRALLTTHFHNAELPRRYALTRSQDGPQISRPSPGYPPALY